MKIVIQMDFETPSKKNSKVMNTKTHRIFPSPKYAIWHRQAMAALGGRATTPLRGPLKIAVEFGHKDRLRRDSDNQLSSILDLLQDAGIISDDRWTEVPKITVTAKKTSFAYAKITITGA